MEFQEEAGREVARFVQSASEVELNFIELACIGLEDKKVQLSL
jgi:hypothetical protein